ncbi:HNH endonuclease [Pseudomonas petrae]|uniref:HNH endonuclease n=1 Tax=Pseudomonas petrae TaxID=2912190 RepID=A0ABS9ID78_9PSED|nr:HNH endonuclease [Pseudomonas petrae]MCF7545605.1 HNH endonuclease [Pseudomonas petrae]
MPAGVDIQSLQWRLCHATTDYEVSEYGHVRRRTPGRKTFPGKILSFCWHRAGYPRFKLVINGEQVAFESHRLVAFAFLDAPDASRNEVAHLDGDPKNNYYKNLAWKTHRENEQDKKLHGTSSLGERNGAAVLTEDSIRAIRERRKSGASLTAIASEFGVVFQTISKIVNGHRWGHVE